MTEQPVFTLSFSDESKIHVNTARWILIIIKILLIPVLAIVQIPFWWLLSVVLAAISLVEYRAFKIIPSILFLNGQIVFKGMVNKSYAWQSIEHIILKDGLLTVDFNNNRLFQKEVVPGTDEQQFNAWCSAKISGLKR